jgi:uncharacterized protein YegP (UPF0339 family)
MAAKFEITQRKNGDYQFNLKSGNGQVILTSQGYKSKKTCLEGVESVKKNAAVAEHFEKNVTASGKPYFNLKATNGQIIGSSEMYSGESARDNGIASVAKNAPEAEIEDLTEKQ